MVPNPGIDVSIRGDLETGKMLCGFTAAYTALAEKREFGFQHPCQAVVSL